MLARLYRWLLADGDDTHVSADWLRQHRRDAKKRGVEQRAINWPIDKLANERPWWWMQKGRKRA